MICAVRSSQFAILSIRSTSLQFIVMGNCGLYCCFWPIIHSDSKRAYAYKTPYALLCFFFIIKNEKSKKICASKATPFICAIKIQFIKTNTTRINK